MLPGASDAQEVSFDHIAAAAAQCDRIALRFRSAPVNRLMTSPRMVLLPAVIVRRFASRALAPLSSISSTASSSTVCVFAALPGCG